MNTTSRRDFLKQAGVLGACACCMGATSLLTSCSSTKGIAGTTETSDMVSIPASAFSAANFQPVKTKKFEQPLLISKQADGTYTAILMHCTHKGGPLNVTGDKMECAWHHSEFSMNGEVLKGPATQPLQSFKVSTDDKNVIVHFS